MPSKYGSIASGFLLLNVLVAIVPNLRKHCLKKRVAHVDIRLFRMKSASAAGCGESPAYSCSRGLRLLSQICSSHFQNMRYHTCICSIQSKISGATEKCDCPSISCLRVFPPSFRGRMSRVCDDSNGRTNGDSCENTKFQCD